MVIAAVIGCIFVPVGAVCIHAAKSVGSGSSNPQLPEHSKECVQLSRLHGHIQPPQAFLIVIFSKTDHIDMLLTARS